MAVKTFGSRKGFCAQFVVFFALVSAVMVIGIPTAAIAKTQPTSNDSQIINWQIPSRVSQSVIQSSASSSLTGVQTTGQSKAQHIQTIPYWSSAFTYQGVSYPYSMVGTNPARGSATTIVPTALIPVKLIFADGAVYNGEKKVEDVKESPLFRANQFTSGYTQYGDAIQRAEFWKYISTKSPYYHVLLTPPIVLPTLTVKVPANEGKEVTRPSGKVFGSIDAQYLDNLFITYMQQHHVSSHVLPIFLAANVLGTELSGTVCCIGGYHSEIANADNSAIQTYAYATYNDPGFSVTNPKVFTNTDALSHELSEWYNDPFNNNLTPLWSVPSQPQYGCSAYLEDGDPLVGVGFSIGKYRLQDETFFSWFAHQVPSIGIKGRYTYLGTFKTVAPGC